MLMTILLYELQNSLSYSIVINLIFRAWMLRMSRLEISDIVSVVRNAFFSSEWSEQVHWTLMPLNLTIFSRLQIVKAYASICRHHLLNSRGSSNIEAYPEKFNSEISGRLPLFYKQSHHCMIEPGTARKPVYLPLTRKHTISHRQC